MFVAAFGFLVCCVALPNNKITIETSANRDVRLSKSGVFVWSAGSIILSVGRSVVVVVVLLCFVFIAVSNSVEKIKLNKLLKKIRKYWWAKSKREIPRNCFFLNWKLFNKKITKKEIVRAPPMKLNNPTPHFTSAVISEVNEPKAEQLQKVAATLWENPQKISYVFNILIYSFSSSCFFNIHPSIYTTSWRHDVSNQQPTIPIDFSMFLFSTNWEKLLKNVQKRKLNIMQRRGRRITT